MMPPTKAEMQRAGDQIMENGVLGPFTKDDKGAFIDAPTERLLEESGLPVTPHVFGAFILGLNYGLRIGEARAKRSEAAS